MELPWAKLDVVTWSWQKVLGGEAQHGMLALSPRAVDRLESYTPPRALPKIFRMTKGGKLNEGIFRGETINTPSMLAVADVLDALNWVENLGGLSSMIARSDTSLQIIADWVDETSWVDFLATDPKLRSSTSICLRIVDPFFTSLDDKAQRAFVKAMTGLLEEENVAFDIAGYRDAPPGLRIWGGGTVEPENVGVLLPWLDWAFERTKAQQRT